MSKGSVTFHMAAMVAVLMFAIMAHPMQGQADYVNPAIKDTDSASYWLDQGGLFSAYGNYAAAVRAYEKSLQRDPGNGEAHFGLGVALGAMGNYSDALARIERAIALTPDSGRYQYGRGWVLILSGRHDEGIAVLRKASDMGSVDARMFLEYLNKK